jgi:hypothetical protein
VRDVDLSVSPTVKFAATALLLGICLATQVTPAEITRIHNDSVDGTVISISGLIEPDDDKKFATIALGIKRAAIVLNSVGGNNNAAGHIGRFIRLHDYETRVPNGAICNSACVLIWIAGSFRHLDRDARLGVHSASTESGPHGKRHEEANKIIAVYLEHMGAPQEMIDLWPVADPCCINYSDFLQANKWGLVGQRPTRHTTTPLPTEETTSRERRPTSEVVKDITARPGIHEIDEGAHCYFGTKEVPCNPDYDPNYKRVERSAHPQSPESLLDLRWLSDLEREIWRVRDERAERRYREWVKRR